MSKIVQFLVTSTSHEPTPANNRRFYPVVVQPTEAKSEKEAEAVAKKAWNVGADEKIKVNVEVFRE